MKKIINVKVRQIVVPFKVNHEEMLEILKRAGAWTDRNVSAYIRYAVLNFKPQKGDFSKPMLKK